MSLAIQPSRILDPQDADTSSPIQKLEKVREYSLPFWHFHLGVCAALQAGEHALSLADAFWLGLIDTIQAAPYTTD
jgi:hypothetical protein